MKAVSVPVHISVCDEVKEGVQFGGKHYPGGYRGAMEGVSCGLLENEHTQLELDLSELGAKPKICDGDKLDGVSVRVCQGQISVIGVYNSFELNAAGCCKSKVCNGTTWTCYGSIWCDPC